MFENEIEMKGELTSNYLIISSIKFQTQAKNPKGTAYIFSSNFKNLSPPYKTIPLLNKFGSI